MTPAEGQQESGGMTPAEGRQESDGMTPAEGRQESDGMTPAEGRQESGGTAWRAAEAATEGAAVAANGSHPERRVLRVIVPRGEDDNACVRLLEQLHIIVVQSPGPDQVQLVLHDRAGGRIELAGADILVRHSADLESQVRTLVGADNLEVLSS